MYGECEACGRDAALACCFCPETGQELYICETCEECLTQDEKRELAG